MCSKSNKPKENYFVDASYTLGLKPRGRGLLSPKSYVDVPAGPRKSDYLYTNFLLNFPPISIPFSKEKHPIWPNWVLFTIICPKYTQIYNKKPPIAIPNFAKKRPKRQAHIRIPCQCDNVRPPLRGLSLPYQTLNFAWNGHVYNKPRGSLRIATTRCFRKQRVA